jgi:hypothetical protein
MQMDIVCFVLGEGALGFGGLLRGGGDGGSLRGGGGHWGWGGRLRDQWNRQAGYRAPRGDSPSLPLPQNMSETGSGAECSAPTYRVHSAAQLGKARRV